MTRHGQHARALPLPGAGCRQAPDIHRDAAREQPFHPGKLITGCWARTFPGFPDQVPQARRFTGDLLNGSPAVDDATLCISELAANAILHSESAGGAFTVRLVLGCAVYGEVDDQGGPWITRPDPGSLRGRGLMIVRELTRAWGGSYGIAGDETGRTAWFIMKGTAR